MSVTAAPGTLPGFEALPTRATLLCLAALTVMSGATIAPSLPALQAHFADSRHSELLIRLVLTLPALFIALGAPAAGFAADRWGRLPLLLASVALYAVAGSSGMFQNGLPGLLAGRALLGIAVAGTMVSVTALAGDYYRGARREKFLGQQAAFTSFGGVVFLIGGGLLADWHWRAPFAIYALALGLLPAVLLYLREPGSPGDIASGATGNAGPLTRRSGLLLGAALAAALINSLSFFLIPTQLPFLLRELGIDQPSRAGLAIGFGNLASAVSALLVYRRIRPRLGASGVFVFSFTLMGLGQLLISSATGYGSLFLALCLFGLGMGSMMPHLVSTVLGLSPPSVRGRAAGALTTSIFFGQFLSPLASQPWADHFGLADCFASAGIILLLIAAVILAVHRRPRTPTKAILQTPEIPDNSPRGPRYE
ncbi:MFS transporter [Microbulbifer hainanensis]|uniref:MFS transporter n=1 Tax=Microbulbifer hainanensis TaxID=2735675 RepID=UPI00186939FC|nr:MFS transporter [Microbulbifer hainanensis]